MDALAITASKPDLSPKFRVSPFAEPDLFQALLAETGARQENARARPAAQPWTGEWRDDREDTAARDHSHTDKPSDEPFRTAAVSSSESDANAAESAEPESADTTDGGEPGEDAEAPASETSEADTETPAALGDDDAPAEAAPDSDAPSATDTQADAGVAGGGSTTIDPQAGAGVAEGDGDPTGLPQPAVAQAAAAAESHAQAFANQANNATQASAAAPGVVLPDTAADQAVQATATAAAKSGTAVPGPTDLQGQVLAAPGANAAATSGAASPTAISAATTGAAAPVQVSGQPASSNATEQTAPQTQAPALGTPASQQARGQGNGSQGDGTPRDPQQSAPQPSGGATATRSDAALAAFARALEASRGGEPATQSTSQTSSGSSGLAAGAPGAAVASTRLAANAQVPTQATNSPLPGEQIAIRIQRAVGLGEDRIRIRLHPAELGQVDVRLQVGNDGAVKVAITADRADTLDLLQRDARGLERALQDAGLKTETGNLSFSLRDGGQNGSAGQRDHAADAGAPNAPEGTAADDAPGSDSDIHPTLNSIRALDITV